METDLGSPAPFPEQEVEIDGKPQWMESPAVLQPVVPIRNISKHVSVLPLSAGSMAREKASHSRGTFRLLAILLSCSPWRKDQKGCLAL